MDRVRRICLLAVLAVFLGNTLSQAFAQSGPPIGNALDPASLLTVEIQPKVRFDGGTGQFALTYRLSNIPASRQRLESFYLTIGPKAGIMKSLPGKDMTSWQGLVSNYPPLNTDTIDWFAARKISRIEEIHQPAPETILPGKRVEGLGAVARNLPGIRLAWYRGWVPPLSRATVETINRQRGTTFVHIEEIPHELLGQLIPQTRPIHEDAVQVKVVGPDVLPDGQTLVQLLNRLISLKHQAVQLGWIGRLKPEEREDDREKRKGKDAREREREDRENVERGKGVIRSLDTKLDAAKLHIERGQIKTAGNLLHAFIHELEAQRGKHLNENAFFLLKPNAEFILSKLPLKEKDDEENDDHRRPKRR